MNWRRVLALVLGLSVYVIALVVALRVPGLFRGWAIPYELVLGAIVVALAVAVLLRKTFLVMLVMLTAAWAGSSYLISQSPTSASLADSVSVPVVTDVVRAGDVVSSTVVGQKQIVRRFLPSDVLLKRDDLEDKLTLRDLDPNQLVHTGDITDYARISVPLSFIPAGTALTITDFETETVAVSSVPTGTLWTMSDMATDERVTEAAVHLLPHRPVLKNMIKYTLPVSVTKHPLPAYHVLAPDDLRTQRVEETLLPGEPAQSPVGQLLLVRLESGQVVLGTHVITPSERTGQIVGLTVSASRALSGNLRAGNCVDVYSSTVTVKAGVTPEVTALPGVPLVRSALVLSAVAIGANYQVALGVKSEEVAVILGLKSEADIALALSPDSGSCRSP